MHGLLGVRLRLVLTAILFVMLANSCGSGICGNEILDEIVSQDRAYIVTVFERSCGATSPIVRVVAIRKATDTFNPEKSSNWIFTIHGRADLSADWNGNSKVHINFVPTGDQPTMFEKWKGIDVTYN